MQFQSLLVIAGVLASSVYAYANETVTQYETTLLTITSCSENKCDTTVTPVIPSVATVTVQGFVTEYTTYCPITAEEEASPASSLAGESVVSSLTETVVTETVSGVETIYTTVCPLTESTTKKAEVETASSEEISYVDLTTTPVVSSTVEAEETVYAQSTLFTSYASNASSIANVSTYEGAANSNNMAVGFAAIAGLAAVLL